MAYPIYNNMAFAFVNGIDSARTYQIPYGGSVLLMDTEKPMFYVKSTNQTGQVSLKSYEFKEVQIKEPSSDFVTKEQFDSLNAKLDQLLKGVMNESDIQPNE